MVPTDELREFPRRSRWRRLAPALALIGLAVLIGVMRPADEETRSLPTFELPLLDGGTLSSSDLDGSPVVLNFFASWCRPCIEEAPALQKTYETYRERGVRFVGVNVQDTEERARAFVKKHGVTYPVVKDYDLVLGGPLGIRVGLPQTFFVAPDGKLTGSARGEAQRGGGPLASLGAISQRGLEREIEALLQQDGEP